MPDVKVFSYLCCIEIFHIITVPLKMEIGL